MALASPTYPAWIQDFGNISMASEIILSLRAMWNFQNKRTQAESLWEGGYFNPVKSIFLYGFLFKTLTIKAPPLLFTCWPFLLLMVADFSFSFPALNSWMLYHSATGLLLYSHAEAGNPVNRMTNFRAINLGSYCLHTLQTLNTGGKDFIHL